MAVASASPERIQQQHPVVEPSPSRLSTDTATSEASESSPLVSCSAGTPDRSDPSCSSPTTDRQSAARLRSEEYRQLFRLPQDETLIEDFNCAFQENILIQGHMYLFLHYICFYSNIFGFETKKIIPFHEVTSVRRAKTAGIFPNAIEIFAGDKKYFFASFLSRDEAYKIISDGWEQCVDDAKGIAEQQESISDTTTRENGVVIEKVESSNCIVNDSDPTDRNTETHIFKGSELSFKVEGDFPLASLPEPLGVVEDLEVVLNREPSSMGDTFVWKEEDCDAPKIPEFYTKVAESKFPIKVEDFFNLFFSDGVFSESFHTSCGDKDFRCTSWTPHEKFGHARDVSFQHPIKIYFGAKFGSCQELQKFRVHKNSHLVIETSQEINDVPYGDYFRVEGLWDVERDTDGSKECSNLRIYLNVAFSKRTVWKGKIVQSTLEECREVFATWINMAHELLKKKNIEEQEESAPTVSTVQKCEVRSTDDGKTGQSSEMFYEPSGTVNTRVQQMPSSVSSKPQVLHGNPSVTSPFSSWLREMMMKFGSSLRSQSHLPLIIVIIVAVIFIMQLSILALLVRPQHIHVHSPLDDVSGLSSGVGGRSSEVITWLEKRVHHLKDEMNSVEARLENMRQEHTLLKTQLEDFKHLSKRK